MNQHEWAKETNFVPNTTKLELDCHANYTLWAYKFI